MIKTISTTLINIGDEILYGQTLNTNAHWLGKELSDISFKVIEMIVIGDEISAITQTLDRAFQTSDLIIMTGGLGPTKDDLTKKVLADYFKVDLYLDEAVYAYLKQIFRLKNRNLDELNKRQAYMPTNCTVLPNPIGTASGMYFNHYKKILVALPGVPYEMKNCFTQKVKPKIIQHFTTPSLVHKFFKLIGIPESILAQRLENFENNLPSNVKLAYLPKINEIDLRLTLVTKNIEEAEQLYQQLYPKLYPILKKYIFNHNECSISEHVAQYLKDKNKTVAVAESCTGGYIAHEFTSLSGSSTYFKGGIIAYDNNIKTSMLDVNSDHLFANGAVSEAVALEMAKGVCQKFKTNYGIGTSGIMGPDGGTIEKPVGTAWIALVDNEGHIFTKRIQSYYGVRTKNIHSTYIQSMQFFKSFINA